MKQFFRDNRRILICTLLGLIAGTLIGISIGLSMRPDQRGSVAETSSVAYSQIGPETSLRVQLRFSGCDHREELILDTEAHVGLTEEALLSRYPSARAERFTSERVLMTMVIDGVCNKHYLLRRESPGVCSVSRADYAALVMETLYTVPINEETMDESLLSELSAGVALPSMAEVNAYLESAES